MTEHQHDNKSKKEPITSDRKTTPLISEEFIKLLQEIPLFNDLPRGELKFLAYSLQIVTLAPGDLLMKEAEVGESFYIVIEGELEVFKGEGKEEKVLAVLGQGEYIGEMSLLIPGGQRSASARAKGVARCWMMDKEGFDELLHRQPHVAYAMVQVLSQRLRNSDDSAFRDLLEKNQQLQKAYDELKDAQAQIIIKERLEKELQLAAQIQLSILPRTMPQTDKYDFGGYMEPARAVGGDFYDLFPLDEDRIAIIIGDVADKGVPSAIFMARTHALLTSEALRGAKPADVIRQVNAYLTRLEQNNLFVTVIYGILDTRNGKFEYGRGGHEMPMLINKKGELAKFEMKNGMPVGIFEEINVDVQELTIEPGGTLILFTDGMTDCRNPQGEDFGRVRLQETFVAQAGKGGEEACNGMIETLSTFRQGSPQDDDVTAVLIHRKK